jgi:hypothetical protein
MIEAKVSKIILTFTSSYYLNKKSRIPKIGSARVNCSNTFILIKCTGSIALLFE